MLKELVKKNRSCRGFDASYRFSKQQLEAFVDLARYTASSANIQPLNIILHGKKKKQMPLLL